MDIFNTASGDLLFSHALNVAYHLILAGAGFSMLFSLYARHLGRRNES